jgi:hypothetical protein
MQVAVGSRERDAQAVGSPVLDRVDDGLGDHQPGRKLDGRAEALLEAINWSAIGDGSRSAIAAGARAQSTARASGRRPAHADRRSRPRCRLQHLCAGADPGLDLQEHQPGLQPRPARPLAFGQGEQQLQRWIAQRAGQGVAERRPVRLPRAAWAQARSAARDARARSVHRSTEPDRSVDEEPPPFCGGSCVRRATRAEAGGPGVSCVLSRAAGASAPAASPGGTCGRCAWHAPRCRRPGSP